MVYTWKIALFLVTSQVLYETKTVKAKRREEVNCTSSNRVHLTHLPVIVT